MPQPHPIASAVAAAILWGTIGIAYKLGVQAGACGDALIVARVALAGLLALPLIVWGRAPVSRWSLLIGAGVLGPLYAVYLLAVEALGAGIASILLYTAPLWVLMLSPAVTGDRPGTREMAALALGLVGVVLVASPPVTSPERTGAAPYLLGLASGVAYALYLLLARLAQLRGAGSTEVGVASLPLAVLGTLLVARPQCELGWVGAPYALYLAVFATLVPYFLNAWALARVESTRVSIISLVEPLTAVLLGALLLGERLAPAQAVGGALVLSSTLVVSLARGRAPRGVPGGR